MGLNYIGTNNELYGCIEDVNNVREALQGTLGYLAENITILTDLTAKKPNRPTILAAFTALITSTRPGDVAFVWYCGHGVQITNATAPSGFSNAWISLGPDPVILETELQSILMLAPAGAKIFVGSDSCHSGTLLDLKFMVGEIRQVRKVKASVPSAKALQGGTLPRGKPRSLTFKTPSSIDRSSSDGYVLVSDASFVSTHADIMCVSGCMDTQTSADTFKDNESQGAMTWSFVKTLESFGKSVKLTDMLASMRQLLKVNLYDQVPQLSMGRATDPASTALDQFT